MLYLFACWRFMLACWLTYGYFNAFSNNVNKKTNKKALFLAALVIYIVIFTPPAMQGIFVSNTCISVIRICLGFCSFVLV